MRGFSFSMMAARSCTPGGRLHTVRIAGSKLRVCDSQTHDATTKTTAMASRLSWVKTRRRRGVRSGDAWSHWLHLSPTASITAASHEESDGARRLGGCVEHGDGMGARSRERLGAAEFRLSLVRSATRRSDLHATHLEPPCN
jgi:hypothetical protein